ncbi:MAG: PhzF family phenazine biosynthesis isomerase [Candidatus Cloacimonetes bacterium]|nr:PhzF family phenazine biosynthesis isomerase [Candidatus Cloacimonadota bacterium]
MKYFVVDSFTNTPYKGNPASVVIVDREITESEMLEIAKEMNHSETAFISYKENTFNLRWFTPETEVNLCGHATLAAAKVLYESQQLDRVCFQTKAGELIVTEDNDIFRMNFPSAPPSIVYRNILLEKMLPNAIETLFSPITNYILAVLKSESEVNEFIPDCVELLKIQDVNGLIITAKGDDNDFVSRFFDPWEGICEDPVTGSAHCVLAPYWSKKLNKKELQGKQLSKRSGSVLCRMENDRVFISGEAVIVMEGKIL